MHKRRTDPAEDRRPPGLRPAHRADAVVLPEHRDGVAAHLHQPRVGALAYEVREVRRLLHVGGEDDRAALLVAVVHHAVEGLEHPVVRGDRGEVLEVQQVDADHPPQEIVLVARIGVLLRGVDVRHQLRRRVDRDRAAAAHRLDRESHGQRRLAGAGRPHEPQPLAGVELLLDLPVELAQVAADRPELGQQGPRGLAVEPHTPVLLRDLVAQPPRPRVGDPLQPALARARRVRLLVEDEPLTAAQTVRARVVGARARTHMGVQVTQLGHRPSGNRRRRRCGRALSARCGIGARPRPTHSDTRSSSRATVPIPTTVIKLGRRPPKEKYRLVTRSDFDGLVCAALLKELEMLDDILFVHPKDMQDGKIEITERDITTNLPYVATAHLSFDHHSSEAERVENGKPNHVMVAGADSAARVVYDYFGGAERFPNVSEEMMTAVDKADAAQFSADEILSPHGWILLSFLMDPRTGLGRFREFRISNYQLMMQLIDSCLELSIDEILETPDVKERVELYRSHEDAGVEQIQRCAQVHDNLVVLDLRDEEIIHPTNRFMVYAIFGEQNISIHALWGLKQQNTVFATGKSIVNRTSRTDVGALMLEYGGGGHEAAGTCQVSNEDAERVLGELIARINADG